jgi:dihydrofolate reductase
MRKVGYSMGVSLDGFIADRDGKIDWTGPDEELHRFHNEQARATDVDVYGRRLYEAMRYWETAEANPASSDAEVEFARIWSATPRIVFSRTLERAEGGAELARGDIGEVLGRLDGNIAIGGAGLAAGFAERDLIDEYSLFVHPIVLGGGTPFFPPLDTRLPLRLLETRTFGSQVTYLRYERAR